MVQDAAQLVAVPVEITDERLQGIEEGASGMRADRFTYLAAVSQDTRAIARYVFASFSEPAIARCQVDPSLMRPWRTSHQSRGDICKETGLEVFHGQTGRFGSRRACQDML